VKPDAARRGHAGARRRELLELDRHRDARVQLLDLAADRAGERLEQLERRAGAERDDDLGDLVVVDGVGEPVARGRDGERDLERQVDAEPPGAAAFGGGVTVVALELEAADEDGVGHPSRIPSFIRLPR
jgi:hypothetical protein